MAKTLKSISHTSPINADVNTVFNRGLDESQTKE
jgi:hypothetical protein